MPVEVNGRPVSQTRAVRREADETNNCIASASVVLITRPDLLISAAGNPPSAAAPGAAFSIAASVHNPTVVTAGASTLRFYLSADEVKSAGDVLVTGTRSVAALGAGATSTGSTSVTVPATTPLGMYRVLACADDLFVVVESDESNNCAASTATVQVVWPDLVTNAIGDPPATAAPGTAFSVVASVRNPSPVAAGASTLRFYVSLDQVKNTGDVLLAATRAVGALAAGLASSAATTLTLPTTLPPNTYYLLGCADDLLKVTESDETNNCRASSNTTLVVRPDLTLASVTNPPATAMPGSSFLVTDAVHNPSPVSAGATTSRYYFSADDIKSAGDVLLGGSRSVPIVAAGGTSTASATVTIPASIPLGRYWLITCADDTVKLSESDETNNCRAAAASVLITWPDLVTTAVSSPPSNLAPGQTFTASDTVLNDGAHLAAASTTRYYFSADSVRDASDVLSAVTRSVTSLAPGQTSMGTKTLTVPTTLPHGRYVVLACADDLGKVPELDNGNNCLGSSDFAVGPPNARPVADAGNDTDVTIGSVVQLNGSGSSDADGDTLSYGWTLLALPPGSSTTLAGASSSSPAFTVDRPGQYVVQLIVHDGREFSVQDVTTITAGGGATRFVAIGDTGLGDAGQYAGAVLLKNTCARSGCDFVALLGDNIYQSGVESVDDEQFGTKFEQPYAEVDVPFYVVLGNHDYGNGGTGDEFHKGQFQVDYTAQSSKWRMPAAYYRFTAGLVEFFGIDTNMQMYGQDAQQRADVASWLGTSTAPWKIALGHHPYRSNGSHGNAGSYNGTSGVPVTSGDGVKSFLEQVVCGRVELYLAGHDHNLQWLQPNGTCEGTELIVSGAGAKPKSLRSSTSRNYNETYFQASQLGFVYLVVTAEQLTAEFVGANGQTLYARTITRVP